MSESVQIVCPVCRSKVRLRGSVLQQATFPCPKCETTLDVPKPEAATPPEALAPQNPAARQGRPPISAADRAASETSGTLRHRRQSATDIPNPWGEDTGTTADGENLPGRGASDFGDDLSGNDFDGSANSNVHGSQKRAGARNSAGALPVRSGQTRRGGFLAWVGYGALAAVVGILVQSVLGLTNHMLPLLIATIATGSLIGYAVRYAAGENNGWGPGIVAVLIAAFAIFAGRVGAFSLSPDINKILGVPVAPLTPQEAEDRVAAESTEPFLIANIADEIMFDDNALKVQGIDSDAAYEHWLEHQEEEDPSMRYMPAIWNEARQRWHRNSPEQKEAQRHARELELRAEYGIMSEDQVAGQITEKTTDNAMIGRIASTLYHDEQWLTQTGITEDQIDEHWENADSSSEEDSSVESHHLPVVWAEAKRRWEEFTPEQREAQVREVSDNLREDLVFSAEDAAAAEQVGNILKFVIIIFGALFTLFWGIGSLICSISALVGAFKIASGMASGNQ